jgi:hypothetical protein
LPLAHFLTAESGFSSEGRERFAVTPSMTH